jgi:hypothetical protein
VTTIGENVLPRLLVSATAPSRWNITRALPQAVFEELNTTLAAGAAELASLVVQVSDARASAVLGGGLMRAAVSVSSGEIHHAGGVMCEYYIARTRL